MELKHTSRILWAALILGWSFDLLFWKTTPGLNFFIFVILNLMVGLLLTYGEGIKPPIKSLALVAPIIFFCVMVFIYKEALTSFLNIVFTLVFMMLLAITLRSGLWLKYSLSDFVVGLFHLGLGTLLGGIMLISKAKKGESGEGIQNIGGGGLRVKPWAVIRGLLLAFPIVFALALLLSSADPIFSKELTHMVNIDRWTEYTFRGTYILIFGYLLLGVFLFAFSRSHEEKLIGVEKPWLKPFLGVTEAGVILVSIDLLLALFVVVQFRYFFGGSANIHIDGFTFAEYARRGFAELVCVAFLSLIIFLSLSSVTRRIELNQRRLFSGLGIGLVILVAIILDSAFQRLLLYESAYGFSTLRTYTHVFMIWLGVLLAATAALEIANRQRYFALAALGACFGFGFTLNILNVDDYIVRQNVYRAEAGSELDVQYLHQLSDDAVPAMFQAFNTAHSSIVRDGMGIALACRLAERVEDQQVAPWQSTHWATWKAVELFQSNAAKLKIYPVSKDENGNLQVKIGSVVKSCYGTGGLMD